MIKVKQIKFELKEEPKEKPKEKQIEKPRKYKNVTSTEYY